ncbi:MAG: GGDEF domain-containing protein [Terriglobus roseus]|nr:GGDEF domain-containing protein [Terriglobus roseus]
MEGEVTRLSGLADRDHLTGLYNRRSFEHRLAMEWRRSARHSSHLTLALVDVDHFKAFNDSYGHLAGDHALRGVAGRLNSLTGRAGDSVFRIGGEEFALILPDTDQAGAAVIGGRICGGIRGENVAMGDDEERFLTVSFGSCSALITEREMPSMLLSYADQALYKAKRTGRNRAVCIARKTFFDQRETVNTFALG